MKACLRAGALAPLVLAIVCMMAGPSEARVGRHSDPTVVTPLTVPKAAKTVHSCHMFAGPGGFGMQCAKPGRDGLSFVEILERDHFPDCWYEKAPRGYVGSPEPRPEELPGSWYIKRCLTGVQKKPDGHWGIVTGPVEIGGSDEFVSDTRYDIVTLTDTQEGDLDTVGSPYPDVLLARGPSASPRVYLPTVFWDVNATRTDERAAAQGVGMRAELHSLKIWAEGPDGGPDTITSCIGGGVPAGGAHSVPSGMSLAQWVRSLGTTVCSHTYLRSSAHLPGHTYPVKVVAYWTVQYSADGTWHDWDTFAVGAQTQQIAVHEIQSLVIS